MKGNNYHNIERLDSLDVDHLFSNAYEAKVSIVGMNCPGCATRVHNTLMQCAGVYAVEVSLRNAFAIVLYDPGRICSHLIEEAVSDAGAIGPHRFSVRVTRVKPHKSRRTDKHFSKN